MFSIRRNDDIWFEQYYGFFTDRLLASAPMEERRRRRRLIYIPLTGCGPDPGFTRAVPRQERSRSYYIHRGADLKGRV